MRTCKIKMKLIVSTAFLSACLLLAGSGCESPPFPQLSVAPSPSKSETDSNAISVYMTYVPARISIMPLTEIVSPGLSEKIVKMKVYVNLTDSFGCQQKTPGVFRFELYEHIQHAANPKGRRITIWPDIDLTDPSENNKFWRDFLRAYEFDLDFEPDAAQGYMLEVTCLCPNGKRLSADFVLKLAK